MNLAHPVGLLYSVMAFGVLLCARFILPGEDRFLESLPSCALKSIMHLPCPTCGMTRSIMALARFEFLTALRMNPLVILIFLIVWAWGCISMVGVIRRRPIEINLTPPRLNLLRVAFATILLAHWLFLILDHR